MTAPTPGSNGSNGDFDEFKGDIDAAERRIAREIDPGARAMVVAICVFVILLSFVLPHTGHVKGFDVLLGDQTAIDAKILIPSRVFVWLILVFSIGFSMLALLTRRWGLAWIALAGSAVSCFIGMLAIWSRNTVVHPYPGPGFGLYLAWLAVILLTFHWARVVWSRTAVQLAAEAQRRESVAEQQKRGLLDGPDED
ncbi:MAG: hypothetical protein P4L86_16775 [Mycobacterium sp.]|nr:hypothetical protein [Mycobacterium sp.]